MHREKRKSFPHFQEFQKIFGKGSLRGRAESGLGEPGGHEGGRLKLQRPLFGFHKTFPHSEINMFENVATQGFSLITSNCSECDNCVYQTYTDFHVFPLAFPDGKGVAAQLHKQSPVGTTRQLLCSRAAIPCRRQILRKSARIESSSFFLEKKNKMLRSLLQSNCWARSRNCKLTRS